MRPSTLPTWTSRVEFPSPALHGKARHERSWRVCLLVARGIRGASDGVLGPFGACANGPRPGHSASGMVTSCRPKPNGTTPRVAASSMCIPGDRRGQVTTRSSSHGTGSTTEPPFVVAAHTKHGRPFVARKSLLQWRTDPLLLDLGMQGGWVQSKGALRLQIMRDSGLTERCKLVSIHLVKSSPLAPTALPKHSGLA